MKTFNDLLNESEEVRLTNNYTKYLLEKQYALTKETAKILLEESDDDDGPSGEPFKRVYKGNKIFVHLDVDGKQLIKVVDSKQEAAMLAQKYPAMAYSGDGELLRLNERTEEGAVEQPSFPTILKQRTASPWAKNIPQAYATLRTQYEKEVQKNIQAEKEFRKRSNLPIDDEAITVSSKWKTIYDNPNFVNVLDVEEYETHGLNINEPLQIEKAGGVYLPVKNIEGRDVESQKRVKFIAPAHSSYIEKSNMGKLGYEMGQAATDTDKLRMAVAAPLVATAALGTLGAASTIPAISKYAAPAYRLAEPLVQAALAGWYGYGKKQQIEKEIEDTLKGKSATAGLQGTGELAVEIPMGMGVAAGAKGPPRGKVARAIVDPAVEAAETAAFKAGQTAPGRAARVATRHAVETAKAIKEKPKEAIAATITTLSLMGEPAGGPINSIPGSNFRPPQITAVESPPVSRGVTTQPVEAPERFSFRSKAEMPMRAETPKQLESRPSSVTNTRIPTMSVSKNNQTQQTQEVQQANQTQQAQEVQQANQTQQVQQVQQDQRVIQTAQIINAVQNAVINQQVTQNIRQSQRITNPSETGKGGGEKSSKGNKGGKGGKGGSTPPLADSDEMGSGGSSPETAPVQSIDDWNLRLRQIYGNLAGTLTK